MSSSGITWAIWKSAPRTRQITTPAPHHSFFLQTGCPSCHPTNSVKALKANTKYILSKSWEWNAFSKWHAMSPIWDFLDAMLCMLWSRSLLKLITCHTFWSLHTIIKHTHTHLTALFPGLPRSAGEQVSRYQKGKTNLDFSKARDSKWQWHQLGYMRLHLAPDRQPHQHPTTLFFTGRIPFLPPNQQCQSTERKLYTIIKANRNEY